ncbi:MAG: hypothetical protein GF388_01645 [Candidatus Aegiribacteria sp.]|nr:hypothetical protein [Candidatus Aegiribacteria sp.]MBD3294077.1 hypothetical protein [Candidatus Fermentibacteria bacterium]
MNAIILMMLAAVSSPFTTDYMSSPDGIGLEIRPLGTRALGMGGVTAGIADDAHLSILNPAASAWSLRGCISFSSRYTNGDGGAWDGKLDFPSASALIPLPGGLVLSGAIDGRSRIDEAAQIAVGDSYLGDFTWSGGLAEGYTGISLAVADWLAVSAGGRCTFGNIYSDVKLTSTDTLPPIPVNTQYRDDARFRTAWGGVFGLMFRSDRFDAGFSISTDRKGTLEIDRDFSGSSETDSSTAFYTVPGELAAGAAFRPLERLTLGCDIYSRKTLNIMGSRTGSGSIYSAGAEYELWENLLVRTGYGYMEGLWRDGAQTVTGGLGYSFGGGRAGLDFSAGYTFWRDAQDIDREESVFSLSLWASEKWLGE